MEARQWRVFLCVRGTVGFFGSFRRLSKALFFRDWCIHSVVSLTASHDSRWNAKNTVEGFSRLPFSVFLPSPRLVSSPVFLRYRCIGYCTNRSPLLASQRLPELEEFSRRRSFQLASMPTQEKRESISINLLSL